MLRKILLGWLLIAGMIIYTILLGIMQFYNGIRRIIRKELVSKDLSNSDQSVDSKL